MKYVSAIMVLFFMAIASCTATKTSNTATGYYVQVVAAQYSIPADGTSTTVITATVKSYTGLSVTDGTVVHFQTTKGDFVTPTVLGQTADVTTTGGTASINLQSTATANVAMVTANVGGISNYTSIQFTATSSSNVSSGSSSNSNSSGSGNSGTGTTPTTFVASNLTATVTELRVTPFKPNLTTLILTASDAAGNAVPNNTVVTYTINNNPGGCAFISSSGANLGAAFTTQTVNSTASALFSSGTHSGVALVTAAYSISGQTFTNSAWIVVDGGPVAGGVHFGMAVAHANMRGLTCYGEPDQVNVYLTDRYSNPVPDGTPVYFSSRGGLIAPIAYTVNGQASTTLYSSILPQIMLIPWPSDVPLYDNAFDTTETTQPFTAVATTPVNGWNEVVAYTYGEEWFNDENQNGVHDPGEPVIHQGDPWIDANQDFTYDTYATWYHSNDGTVCSTYAAGCFTDTITLTGPLEPYINDKIGLEWYWPSTTGAPYSPPAADPTNSEWSSQTAVWNHIIVVYSGEPAISFTPTAATLNTTTATVSAFTVYFGDMNGNALSAGSTIAAALQGVSGVNVSPQNYDAHTRTIGTFVISTTAQSTPGSGFLVLTLTTPNFGCNGGKEVVSIPVTVQ